MPPYTRNFSAFINLQPLAENKLVVVGEVETPSGQLLPRPTRHDAQSDMDHVLKLDLQIVKADELQDGDMTFRGARYEEPAIQGQYKQVDILWENDVLLSLAVDEVV